MERDLLTQVDVMIQNVFQDRISEDEKTSLKSWFISTLESERLGWKQKLNMAMNEIEKERRLALEVHDVIHRINEKLEQNSAGFSILSRESSVYCGAEKDMKVSHMVTLERNVDSLVKMVTKTLEEKREFLECILGHFKFDTDDRQGVELKPGSLVNVAKELTRLKEELERVQKSADETEARLSKEIDVLTGTIQIQENMMDQEKHAHVKHIKELKHSISHQKGIPQCVKQSKTSLMERGGETNDRSQSENIRDNKVNSLTHRDQCTEVLIKPGVRECCIQTDMDMVSGPVAHAPDGVKHTEVGGKKEKTRGVGLPSDKSSTPDNEEERHSSADFTQNALNEPTKRSSDNNKSMEQSDMDKSYAIEHLRNQVVTFAEKLEKARWKMGEYEQQMTLIRTSPKCKYRVQQRPELTGISLHRKWKSSDNYLGGIRKDLSDKTKTMDSIVLSDKKTTAKDRPNGLHGLGGGTNTCFRCHKLYKTKENHRLACRYHSKSKQKIERYDNTGKLVKIVQVWECCMQRDDAIGCTVGEHI